MPSPQSFFTQIFNQSSTEAIYLLYTFLDDIFAVCYYLLDDEYKKYLELAKAIHSGVRAAWAFVRLALIAKKALPGFIKRTCIRLTHGGLPSSSNNQGPESTV